MLHALYNLTAREKKKKIISVVQANSRVTCAITSLWVLFGLACQHFNSYYVSVPVPTMFPSPKCFRPRYPPVHIVWKHASNAIKSAPRKLVLPKSMFKFQIILGDPGVVSRDGRKGATKVFKHRRKSPWVPTLTGPFPNGQANAGSWLGTKNALYYCAQSANSFSRVLFVSSYTTAIISPQLPGSFTKLS